MYPIAMGSASLANRKSIQLLVSCGVLKKQAKVCVSGCLIATGRQQGKFEHRMRVCIRKVVQLVLSFLEESQS